LIPKPVSIFFCVVFLLGLIFSPEIFSLLTGEFGGDARIYTGLYSAFLGVLFLLGPISSGFSIFIEWSFDHKDFSIVEGIKNTGVEYIIWRNVRQKIRRQ